MYVIKDNTFNISVRNLVEFMCLGGDIDNRDTGVADVKVMQEGARLHRKIQHSMGSNYRAEVLLRNKEELTSKGGIEYELRIEGRADGIIADIEEDEDGSKLPIGGVTIDEIKTMQADVTKLKEPVYVHKAQAMVYAYIYLTKYNLESIDVQLTYCNTETEKIVRFKEQYDSESIIKWYRELVAGFKKWMDYVFDERAERNASIQKLHFPFEYREGQKKLVASVYHTVKEQKVLYIQAPTGVGKTISIVYPAVQSCSNGLTDKIFYLTSKTITRTVAEETYAILRSAGLHFRTVTLTAKDKICHLDEHNCNPEVCEYARGHFDRVNEAVYDIITNEAVINRDTILQYSVKHKVCPYEMSLDVSYWCDGIICDYNYAFDPDSSLKRYFGDGGKGNYVFLVDEAHNLVDRAREMYSATLVKEDFLACKRVVKDMDKRLASYLEKCNKYLLELKRACDKEYIIIDDYCGTFLANLQSCYSYMQKFLDKNKGKPVCDEIIEFFFKIRHFINMYDCIDEKYVIYAEHIDDGDFALHLYCVDPSGQLSQRLSQGISTIMFSATLLPVNYFKEMLSGNADDYAVYAHSPFDTDNKRVLIGRDVTSRYTRRNYNEYTKIAGYIHTLTQSKQGKYMIFFPSYSYMREVYDIYIQKYACNVIDLHDVEDGSYIYHLSEGENVLIQDNNMTEADKENFLSVFMDNTSGNVTGFCVLGGIFSEGIDLRDKSLIGACIVGTGIPMICRQRNILRNYFDSIGKNGYQYAYVFPGMNKVLQAAGRVIRTADDKGIILLLDDRFMTQEYQMQYPREWDKVYPVDINNTGKCIEDFWRL